MNCTECGNAIGAGLKFCTSCGTPVQAPAPPAARIEHARAAAGNCAKCGAALKPGLRFCTACGERVEPAASPGTALEDATVIMPAMRLPPASGSSEHPAAGMPVRKLQAKSEENETASEVVEVSPGGGEEDAVRRCAKCGGGLGPAAMFCTLCGARAAGAEPETAPEDTTEIAPTRSEVAPEVPQPVESTAAAEESREEAAPASNPEPEEPAAQSGPARAAAPSGAPVCPQCGATLSPGVRFCIDCGAPADAQPTDAPALVLPPVESMPPPSAAPAPIQRPGISAGALVSILLVLLLVVVGLAYWLIRSMRYSPPSEETVAGISAEAPVLDGGEDAQAPGATTSADLEPEAEAAPAEPATELASPAALEPAPSPTAREPASNPAVTPPVVRMAPSRPADSTPTQAPPPASSSRVPTARTAPAPSSAPSVQAPASPPPRTPVPFVDEPGPAETAQAPPPPAAGRILRPSDSSPPASAPAAPAPAPVQPSTSAAPTDGIIYWMGKLEKNRRIVIGTKGADYGFADGKLLPGTPVEVRVPSPAVSVVEAPGPSNNWQRVVLQCNRSTNQTVTINVQWFAAK